MRDVESGRRAIILRLLFCVASGRFIDRFIRLRFLSSPYPQMLFSACFN
jgi:hypothetical protein